jgi:hypothetical protein
MTVKTPVIFKVGDAPREAERGSGKRSEPISEPERPLRNLHEREHEEREKGVVPKSSTR